MARDLPTFDSVWLDALVRQRNLTPFQAERLARGGARGLQVAGYLLVEPLGCGAGAQTFLARPAAGGPSCVVKILDLPPGRAAQILQRCERLTADAATLNSRNAVVPHGVATDGEQIVFVSREVAGTDAGTLLVRRGRFPPAAVAAIAQQLLTALAMLRRSGIAHGEVRLANIRMTPRGEAVLVDAGVRPITAPSLSIHDLRPPQWYDGMAPERIGTAAPPTIAADLYALGCVLWHLLAGRAVFPYGDALAKLAAHRTRPVPDVTDFAPDAPPELVRLIERLTAGDPDQRPEDLLAEAETLRPAVRSGRAQLVRFATGQPRGQARRSPWPLIAAAACVLAGAGFWLQAARTGPVAETSVAVGEPQVAALAQLPPPDAAGLLILPDAGPYAAAEIATRGSLVLRGGGPGPTRIVITDRPLRLWADEITLENIEFDVQPIGSVGGSPPAALLVETQALTVNGCRFEGIAAADSPNATVSPTVAIGWRLIDRADPTAGRIVLSNTVLRNLRDGLHLADAPRQLTVRNVLGVRLGSLAMLRARGRSGVAAVLENVTLRENRTVFGLTAAAANGGLRVTAQNSILDLPGGSLFHLAEAAPTAALAWDGAGVVVTGDVQAVVVPGTAGNAVSNAAVAVGGVVRGEVQFAGPAGPQDSASAARVTAGPRVDGALPGVQVARLPQSGAPARVLDRVQTVGYTQEAAPVTMPAAAALPTNRAAAALPSKPPQ